MSKAELRKKKQREASAAGDVGLELAELRKLQRGNQLNGIHTITTECSQILTLVCC